MRTTAQLAIFAVLAAASGPLFGQATPGTVQTRKPATVSAAQEWDFNLTVDGYIIADGTSYVNPVFTADHNWLHMEGRSTTRTCGRLAVVRLQLQPRGR